MANPKTDNCISLVDVIALNRYYGWYVGNGDLETAERATRDELKEYSEKFPDKPIMYTEYGADTIPGLHSNYDEPFSVRVPTKITIGWQAKSLMNFHTLSANSFGTLLTSRQNSVFNVFKGTRRESSLAPVSRRWLCDYLKNRWTNIPNFDYKKK